MPSPLEMIMKTQQGQAGHIMGGGGVTRPVYGAMSPGGGTPAMTQSQLGGPGGFPGGVPSPAGGAVQSQFQHAGQMPSASQDALTALFNASSGIDMGPLNDALASIQNATTRTAAGQASNAASQALGSGASGTPVAALANDAVGNVLAQSEAQQSQTALDYILGRSGQNIGGLTNTLQGALAGEGQAFDQQFANVSQQADLLGRLMGFGGLMQAQDQAGLDAQWQEYMRLNGANPGFEEMLAIMNGTPLAGSPGQSFDFGPAGVSIGTGLADLMGGLGGGGAPQKSMQKFGKMG